MFSAPHGSPRKRVQVLNQACVSPDTQDSNKISNYLIGTPIWYGHGPSDKATGDGLSSDRTPSRHRMT